MYPSLKLKFYRSYQESHAPAPENRRVAVGAELPVRDGLPGGQDTSRTNQPVHLHREGRQRAGV